VKRLLITGGAGFIGSNALTYFSKIPNYEIVAVVDKLTYAADKKRVTDLGLNLYNWDINDLNWTYVFERHEPDVVINFAAESHVDNSIKNWTADSFIWSNYSGVASIVNNIRNFGEHTGKRILLVQVSTDEVLGDIPVDSAAELDESSPIAPNNVYSATKAAAEQLLWAMWHTSKDFEYMVVRATNNYGPNQHFEKLLPTIISKATNNSHIPVYGTGDNIREWLWSADFVRGIHAAIERGRIGEVYHFGSGVRKSNLEVTRTILQLMNKNEDLIEFVRDRPGHDRKYALRCTKAREKLGWNPTQKFEDGLQIVIGDVLSRLK
jgi:dTDP-glucose 4,6-dehydratase